MTLPQCRSRCSKARLSSATASASATCCSDDSLTGVAAAAAQKHILVSAGAQRPGCPLQLRAPAQPAGYKQQQQQQQQQQQHLQVSACAARGVKWPSTGCRRAGCAG
jgi:hypothetical protein